MKKIILFIDGRYPPHHSSIDKTIELARTLKCMVEIIFDTRHLVPKRWYWPEIFTSETLQETAKNQQQLILDSIQMRLASAKLNVKLHEVNYYDLAPAINKIAVKDESPLLIIDAQLNIKKHELIQQLHLLKIPVLFTSNKNWHTPLNLVAAVDPLHEYEPMRETDQKLVKYLKAFSKIFDTEKALVHSCYVPPMAIKHRKEINKLHEKEIQRLASHQNIKSENLSLLEGPPDESLARWCQLQNTDILIMGLLARGSSEIHHLGSTTLSLLEKTPCDLLLIP